MQWKEVLRGSSLLLVRDPSPRRLCGPVFHISAQTRLLAHGGVSSGALRSPSQRSDQRRKKNGRSELPFGSHGPATALCLARHHSSRRIATQMGLGLLDRMDPERSCLRLDRFPDVLLEDIQLRAATRISV